MDWTVTGGEASTSDFAGGTLPSGLVQFGVNETTKTISIAVNGDTEMENDETFQVNLSNPSVGTSISDYVAEATIINDDQPPSVSISANNGVQSEGNSGTTTYQFTVTLDGVINSPVTVNYSTNNGTATLSDGDYIDNDGIVTFNPGDSLSQIIEVWVNGDSKEEADETFTVSLDGISTNATIDENKATATGIILNDDSAPVVSIDDITVNVNEGNGLASLTIRRSGSLDNAISFEYFTSNDKGKNAAKAGEDYQPVNQTL